jgi:hypothetical protein
MSIPKKFEEYIGKGIVRKGYPNKNRSNFLSSSSEKLKKALNNRIKVMGITDEQAESIIKEVYDIIMDKIRSKMLIEGYNASGFGAHEAEVSFMENLGFNRIEIEFMNQLRIIRNRIMYYGEEIDAEYARKALEFMKGWDGRLR